MTLVTLVDSIDICETIDCNEYESIDIDTASLHSYFCSSIDDNSSVETNSVAESYPVQYAVTDTNDRKYRLAGGILIFINNEIANCKTEEYKIIHSEVLRISRAKRMLRFTNHNVDIPTVKYSNITIREYPYDIGDNPSSSSSPSLSIQWKHQFEQTMSVDKYEESVPIRRKGRQMLIPAQIRFKMLRNEGYTFQQIRNESRAVNRIREQRRRTVAQLELTNIHEISEKIKRKTLNLLSFGNRKRRENEYLAQANAFVQSQEKFVIQVVPTETYSESLDQSIQDNSIDSKQSTLIEV
jgi:hypothetical protein